MTYPILKESLATIGKALSLTISDPTNGNELVVVLSEMMQLQALSADTVARSESFLNREIAKVIESDKYKDYPASDRKHLIQRDCAEYVEVYNKAQAYNKECHYKIESLRTLISNAKELLRQNI